MTSSVEEVFETNDVIVVSKKGLQFGEAVRRNSANHIVIDLVRLWPELNGSLKFSRKESVGRILMFVENAYPNDTRVRNEAETLCKAGYSVTVVCLREKGQPRSEMVNGVQAYRLPRLSYFRRRLPIP